jgi:hypothetical protein
VFLKYKLHDTWFNVILTNHILNKKEYYNTLLLF